MPNQTYILPCAYAGNILCYTLLTQADTITDQHSHYIKQTYANRCSIMTASGVTDLTIPIVKPKEKTPVRDIRISSHGNWRLLHWRTIETAYNSTPFFEYFRDELAEIYEQKWDFLLDFNQNLQKTILKSLNYPTIKNSLSDSYIQGDEINAIDYRNVINPKKFNVSLYNELKAPYHQLFSEKFGFSPNLSMLDMLFNIGCESRIYLRDTYSALSSRTNNKTN